MCTATIAEFLEDTASGDHRCSSTLLVRGSTSKHLFRPLSHHLNGSNSQLFRFPTSTVSICASKASFFRTIAHTSITLPSPSILTSSKASLFTESDYKTTDVLFRAAIGFHPAHLDRLMAVYPGIPLLSSDFLLNAHVCAPIVFSLSWLSQELFILPLLPAFTGDPVNLLPNTRGDFLWPSHKISCNIEWEPTVLHDEPTFDHHRVHRI